MLSASQQTSVIVIRVWLEMSHEAVLRARITSVQDLSSPRAAVAAAASVDDVLEVVRGFLFDVLVGR
jgi:hypothetical protein